MPRILQCAGRLTAFALIACLAVSAGRTALGSDTDQIRPLSPDELWRRSIDLVGKGDFRTASDYVRQIDEGGSVTERVRSWLQEYETQQAQRRELDRQDFDKYVGYAQARIGRKEYRYALDWALMANDCAPDHEAFLKSDWLQSLVNDALAKAEEYRKEADWRKCWHIYSALAVLYEHEPRYQELEAEVETLLRLDFLFDEKNDWQERLEKVQWADADEALEHIEAWYVEPPDFKKIAESGLRQLLLLAESKAAQKTFEGLGNEFDRKDFEDRVRERLEQVRVAPTLSRRETAEIFERVVKKINDQTVRLPRELVVSELMRGGLEPLDEYTSIIWPLAADEFDKHTRGDFIGVGISIIKNRLDEIEVVTPLEDTPAYEAGVQAGDIIVKVDGNSLEGYSLNKVVDTITGPKDTQVTLTIRRDSDELDFTLRRDKVKIQSVKGVDRLESERWNHWLDKDLGVGYIRILNFQRNTVEDVKNVLSELEAGGLRGLVLDLRGNPGGLLDTAYQISSLFLDKEDNVVSTRGRNRSENQDFDAYTNGPWSDLPMTILVDEGSASASEIVAGAVRDNQHGVVVGETTFGKFSVQNLIPLRRSRAKLKLTTARYYLPSGVSLHRTPTSEKWGVEPDIPVKLVQKERINLWKMRREAERIGPAKQNLAEATEDQAPSLLEAPPETAAEAGVGGPPAPDETDPVDGMGELFADESDDGEKLPPLEQPDENNRPMDDPQLDTALLLMRVKLLAEQHPTLAHADARTTPAEARP